MGPMWQSGFQGNAPGATAPAPQWGAPGAMWPDKMHHRGIRPPMGFDPTFPPGVSPEPMMPPGAQQGNQNGGQFNGQTGPGGTGQNGQMGPGAMGQFQLPVMPWGKGGPPNSEMIMQNIKNLLPLLQKMNMGGGMSGGFPGMIAPTGIDDAYTGGGGTL